MANYRRLVIKISLLAVSAFLMVQFTNCSKYNQPVVEAGSVDSNGNGSLSLEEDPLLNFVPSGDICEDDLQKIFLGGYYKMARVNCAGCHMKDADKPQFASLDYNWAFTVFKSKGYEKVSSNAISTTHKPPATGLHLLAEVTELKSEWKKGLENYNICKGLPKEGLITDPNLLTTIQTISKPIPVLEVDQSRDIVWNITNELSSLKADTPVPNFGSRGSLRITVTHRKTSSGEEYYTLKNPRIYNNATGVIVKGLHVKLNSRFVSQQTTYRYLSTSIAANTADTSEFSLLAAGAMVLLGRPTAQDYLNLAFEVLQDGVVPPPPPPALVKFNAPSPALPSNVVIIKSGNPDAYYIRDFEILATGAVPRPIVVSVNEVTSNICGQSSTTSSFTVSSTCLPEVNAALTADPELNNSANRKFYTARSIVGTNYNRFDWDFRLISDQLNLQSAVDASGSLVPNPTGKIRIKFSKDERKEDGNRVLRLGITLSSSNGILTGTGAVQTLYVVFVKVNNPEPGYDEITYSSLMNPLSGTLRTKCINCHNSVAFNGGYDITDYEQMISRGILIPFDENSLMFRRTNSQDESNKGLSPMPANGGLDDLVERPNIRNWILKGAKNN